MKLMTLVDSRPSQGLPWYEYRLTISHSPIVVRYKGSPNPDCGLWVMSTLVLHFFRGPEKGLCKKLYLNSLNWCLLIALDLSYMTCRFVFVHYCTKGCSLIRLLFLSFQAMIMLIDIIIWAMGQSMRSTMISDELESLVFLLVFFWEMFL